MNLNKLKKELSFDHKLLNVFKEKAKKIELTRGDILYQKDESPHGFYYIESGLMALMNISPNGSESLLRVFSKNDFIGHRTFLCEDTYHAFSMSLCDTVLYRLPFFNVNDIFEHRELNEYLLKTMARDLRFAEERINDLTGKKVTSRVVDALVFLKQRHNQYSWTRKEIGEFCGAKTETVTRELSKLEKLGLISKDGREIIINDIESLIAYKIESDLDS